MPRYVKRQPDGYDLRVAYILFRIYLKRITIISFVTF